MSLSLSLSLALSLCMRVFVRVCVCVAAAVFQAFKGEGQLVIDTRTHSGAKRRVLGVEVWRQLAARCT